MTETKSADELAAILNGDPSMPPAVGPQPAAAPSRADELKIHVGPVDLPPVQASDARHALRAGGKGYAVKVRGLYFANNPSGKGKVKMPYELVVNVAQLEGAKSTIKNKLLLPALKRKFPDAVRHRTLHIVSATPLSADTAPVDNLDYLTRGALENYAKSVRIEIKNEKGEVVKKVPFDVSSFPANDAGTTALRESLIDHRQNPEGFAVREAERVKKRLENAELAVLNPDLAVGETE